MEVEFTIPDAIERLQEVYKRGEQYILELQKEPIANKEMISFIENGNDQIISAIECLFVVYHKSIGLWQQV